MSQESWYWRVRPMHKLRQLLDELERVWTAEEDMKMRLVAQRYAERSLMEGHVIQATGEVIPRESV